jgi:antitoxin component of RelBE/YafQ-DinJ toxin-antitoxin module
MHSNGLLSMKFDALTKWSANVVCSRKKEKKRANGQVCTNLSMTILRIGYFQQHIKRSNIPFRPLTNTAVRARSTQEVDTLEESLREHEERLNEMTTSNESLQQRYMHLTELRHVLRETAQFFDQVKKG